MFWSYYHQHPKPASGTSPTLPTHCVSAQKSSSLPETDTPAFWSGQKGYLSAEEIPHALHSVPEHPPPGWAWGCPARWALQATVLNTGRLQPPRSSAWDHSFWKKKTGCSEKKKRMHQKNQAPHPVILNTFCAMRWDPLVYKAVWVRQQRISSVACRCVTALQWCSTAQFCLFVLLPTPQNTARATQQPRQSTLLQPLYRSVYILLEHVHWLVVTARSDSHTA